MAGSTSVVVIAEGKPIKLKGIKPNRVTSSPFVPFGPFSPFGSQRN